MKVLLVTSSYENSWPFLPELRNALLKENVVVHILDVTNLLLIKEDGETENYRVLAKLNRLKGGHRFIRFTATNFIKNHFEQYDAINIHHLEFFYHYLIDQFKEMSPNVSVSIWGSDFYRASNKRIKTYLPLFQKLNYIGFGNEGTRRDFEKKVPGFEHKHKIASFGIGKFEVLRELFLKRQEIKKEFEIPDEKITVVCGYNAYEAQQHTILLDQINNLPIQIKDKIFLIFPLTYGGNEEYKQKILKYAADVDCQFRAFTGFASDIDIAKIRALGDIVLNAQISDSFSASLQEHVLCNAVLVAGDWLPYQVMTDLGLTYFPVPLDQFGTKLEDIINHYESYRNRVKDNYSILYKEGIWENRVRGWINLYKAKNDPALS